MGLPQITGNQVCPKCKNLGRVRMKNCRSRCTARYIERSWFRHNDKNMSEHYIDNFTRYKDYEKHPFGKTLGSIDSLYESHNKIEHAIKLMEERFRLYHGPTWSHDEKRWFYMELDKFWKTVIEPKAKIINWYRRFGEFIRTNPASCLLFDDDELIERLGLTGMLSKRRVSRDRMMQLVIDQGYGPLLEQIGYLYEKYEIPRRRKRDENRRKDLSEWRGRPTDDYTGMENTVATKIQTV